LPKSQFFQSRADEFSAKAVTLNKQFQLYATIRIFIFLIGLALLIYFANERNASAIFFVALPTIILFSLIVKAHNKIRYKRDHAEFLTGINKNEVKRIHGDLATLDQGKEFLDDDHPYSSDLDVFGRNSLFQLINRTSTQPGRRMLASWFSKPAAKDEILSRQKAVKELADDVDWGQKFQASAMHSYDSRSDYSELDQWLQQPEKINANIFLKISSYLFPILIIGSITGIILGLWPHQLVWPLFIANGIILSRTLEYAQETSNKASKSLQSLRSFSSLIFMAEKRKFQTHSLKELQETFIEGDINASTEIEKLAKIMHRFDSRSNAVYFFIDLIFLYDIHLLNHAESWKTKNGQNVQKWIYNISKLEALTSMAASLHTHDNFTLPEINENNDLKILDAGHPLIDPKERVNNDFEMHGLGSEIIITGSNMSGKSTFLRTLGINMIMAYAGGAVCCKYANFPLVSVYTSMRTHDNLEEHISSFYAELKRIKGLLDLFERSEIPVFYLLDEILKGTNSVDRHLGAKSLIVQLLKLNGMGLISTHDINLGTLSDKFTQIQNFSFNSKLNDDEIVFDYRIHEGVCKGFNASKLMEKMGIILKTNNE
jgi:hypothetical protein